MTIGPPEVAVEPDDGSSVSTGDPAVRNGADVQDSVLAISVEPGVATDGSSDPKDDDDRHRRDLIRALFNDFWAGLDEKPATFAERLDAAEDYINGRLAERRVGWRLDAATRKQLGLPSPQKR
jgi:hypothetical protein